MTTDTDKKTGKRALKHCYQDVVCNDSTNPSFLNVAAIRFSRRTFLRLGVTSGVLSTLPACASLIPSEGRPNTLGFTPIAANHFDTVTVPEGYEARVLYAWGDPISEGPSFKKNAANSAWEQGQQAGMHHDGIEYFPLPRGSQNNTHALLAINHEYCDNGLLFPDGERNWSLLKARKAQNALGVSIIEIRKEKGLWQVVRPSSLARRITARTPMRFTGAAAGCDLLKTKEDQTGFFPKGTAQNCSNGKTPWGTYLTCEENWSDLFTRRSGPLTPLEKRYGIQSQEKLYRWSRVDPRFECSKSPNEAHRFGWIVEIDPYDPKSIPRKHTALGRIKHESATFALGKSNKAVVYTGDDEKFEYIYKFVSKHPYKPSDRAHNLKLLEEGELYVARFNADGSGIWLPLVFNEGPLTPENGFKNQAEILVKTRLAADAVGATKMDRPEWIAVDPKKQGGLYCTLTNNDERGMPGMPGVDAANPRANNLFGSIIHWQEANEDPESLVFQWDIFSLAGLKNSPNPNWQGTNDVSFGSPDGLKFDSRGVMWVETDVKSSTIDKDEYQGLGNNQLFAIIPGKSDFQRFLVGPRGCELTGIAFSPDNKSLFVNIQHPGESGQGVTKAGEALKISTWPDGLKTGRPRSATLVIHKKNGGIIGT